MITLAIEDHPFALPIDIELQPPDCVQSLMDSPHRARCSGETPRSTSTG